MSNEEDDDFARRQIRGGIAKLGGGVAVVRLIDVAASFYLLRLLTERDMGLAALAGSLIIVLESLCGFGLRTSIVAAESISLEERRNLIGFTTSTGFGFALLASVAAWPLAILYGEPVLTSMVVVSSLKLVLVSLALVPQALLSRKLAFGALAGLQTVGALAGALSKVGLAHLGLGAWALVWANVLSGLVVLTATWITFWPGWPRLRFRFATVAWHVKFGARAALSGLLSETSKNLDYFLVGLLLGMGPLGVYRVAFDIAVMPLESIAQPIYRVTFSVFARMSRDGDRLFQAFVDATRSMIALTSPVAVVLFLGTDDLLALVTRGGWEGAVPVVQLLCWAAFFRTVTRLFDNLFYARREPGIALLDAVATFLLLAAGMPVGLLLFGAEYGILVPAHVWLWTYPVVYGVLFAIAVRRKALAPGRYLVAVAPAIVATLATLGAGLLADSLSAGFSSPLARLSVVAGAAALAYLAVVRYGVRLRLRPGTAEHPPA